MKERHPTLKEFQPGRGYSKEDWDAVDSPELTDEELARMRPACEVLPPAFFKAVEEMRNTRGRPRMEAPKVAITLRLDPDVLEKYKAGGKDWRAVMAKELRKAAGL